MISCQNISGKVIVDPLVNHGKIISNGPRTLNSPLPESHVKNMPAAIIQTKASHNLFSASS
jgi:hypothetical protein